MRLSNFTYLTFAFDPPDDWAKLYAGVYCANQAYQGPSDSNVGFMAGYEVPIGEGQFALMGDYLSGTSGISVAVVGGIYNLTDHWQVSAGVQVPNFHSHNSLGAVLELTYVPCFGRACENVRTAPENPIARSRSRLSTPHRSRSSLVASLD